MIPFALRIIAIPVIALAGAIGAFIYFRAPERPPAAAAVPQSSQRGPPQTATPAVPSAAPPQSTAALQGAALSGSSPPAGGAKPPEFDIVRVTPSGETVVAGRAPGAARVGLLGKGKGITGGRGDQKWQVVLLSPGPSG